MTVLDISKVITLKIFGEAFVAKNSLARCEIVQFLQQFFPQQGKGHKSTDCKNKAAAMLIRLHKAVKKKI